VIQNVQSFIRYFDGIRQRTLTFARAVPAQKIDWAPQDGEFTCGDILRHIAAIERITIAEVVGGRWEAYPGHGPRLARDLQAVIAYLESTHAEAMHRLGALPDEGLQKPRAALTGQPLRAWRLLMAMVEHEVHHRSQLACYLASLGVEPPQIYGLGVDDVIALSREIAKG
jgi:uncharacterized damage-inducible protein DinB